MHLSPQRFQELQQSQQLVLSLIGMSNIGKTYWSQRLARIGFAHVDCDARIEAQLAPFLQKHGYSGIADVARWMGLPYEERFAHNQERYLNLEKALMHDIFASLQEQVACNIVIDTTGSVVHTGQEICSHLQQHSLVVYIEASEQMQQAMFENYLKHPKPVVFGEFFQQYPGEQPEQALRRSYKSLLKTRSEMYHKYADVTLSYQSLPAKMDAKEFLGLIQSAL